jgi:RimJ/RimL family protein N-acetyltransferase
VGHWHFRGFGQFAVEEKDTGTLVGRVGPWQPEGWPDFEIGWALRREFWGRGYATEAAERCVSFAFTELQRPHLVSLIDPDNVPSIRVAERLGERLEGEFVLPHQPNRPVRQYGLHKSDWTPRS